jgi:Ca2+-binding EF-hand superfamily protein
MVVRACALMSALVLFPAVAIAQQPCTGDARHVVNEIYRHVLERSADRGSDQMVRQLRDGATVRDIVRGVVSSSEHQQRFMPSGNREANERAVSNLYRHILGRNPDPGGLQANVAGLESSGASVVIDALLNSAEYQQAYGDMGVPGSPGLRYCGSQAQGSAGTTGRTAPAAMRFTAMDSNRDGRITRGEWRGTEQSFKNHDWNNDAVLSGDEVRSGATRPAPAFDETDFNERSLDRFDSWTAASFTSIDHNRDNRITENEWHHGYEVFRRVDRNADGALSRNEFLATDVDDDREDSFDNLDANNDGRVDRSEWHGSAETFKWLDRNNNNLLSRAEVVGEQRPAADRFANLDIDRNGRLTIEEWHWSRRSFNQQDGDRDGAITRREFTGTPAPTGTTGR